MTLSEVVVNRVTPTPPRACGWCDARRGIEAKSIGQGRRRLPGIAFVGIAARDAEPRGVRALTELGAEIDRAAEAEAATSRPQKPRRYAAAPLLGSPVIPLLLTADTRLLLFGGKGGVGKTTCAAAAAIGIAGRQASRRVHLLSADPAHSLADVLGVVLSGAPRAVPGGPPNLRVREIDAHRGFQQVRARYAAAVDRSFDRLSRGGSGAIGIDATHDRRVMHGLMDLAPPGIDELAAVIEVIDTLGVAGGDGADLIVMDTAPSGHALRLLEMPALAQDWARALMSILLKYQAVSGVGELGAVLLRMSQGLGRLKDVLANPERTSFVAVTRAAVLPREETGRLVARLQRMGVCVPLILVNAVGRGTCARCRAATTKEQRELKRLADLPHRGTSRVPVAVAPAEMPPPFGVSRLRRWLSTWRITPAAS
jgi:arsenite-transporting ATPase